MYRINCVLRLFRGERPWLDLRVGVCLGLRFGGRVLRRPGRIRTCLDVCSRVCTAHARARGGCGIIRRKGGAKARVCRVGAAAFSGSTSPEGFCRMYAPLASFLYTSTTP